MKRAAFTMIELIFVIVILGILASVAIPKLAGVQDDAYVSLEKSGIASVRSGALAVRSRALLRGTGQDFQVDVEFDDINTPTAPAQYLGNTAPTGLANELSPASKYPYGLSVAAVAPLAVVTYAGNSGTGMALAVVLGAEGRRDWGSVQDANATVIAGPATLNVQSATAEYNQNGSWTYNPGNGLINYDGNTSYSSKGGL